MTTKLFYIWLLLTPFSWIIGYYSGVIAIDKLLAPFLLLASIFANRTADRVRINRIFSYALLVAGLLFLKNLSFVGDSSIFLPLLWDDMIKAGYFIIPILNIKNLKVFHHCGWIVALIGVLGLLSCFFVAIGILNLPIQRFETTRIGVEHLQKSIGLFPSYGDLAQFVSFTIMWLIVVPGVKSAREYKWKVLRFILFIAFVLGIIGAQSRNVLLSGMLTLGLYWLLQKQIKNRAGARTIIIVLTAIGGLFGLALLLVFMSSVIEGLSSIGGGLAQQTASTRLSQYAFGWEVIKNSPFFGINLQDYKTSAGSISYIHNMWISLTATGGLFSSALLLILLIRIYILTRKVAYVPAKQQEVMVTTAYFFILLFSTLFYPALGELFWVLLGIAASITCFHPYSLKSAQYIPAAHEHYKESLGANR